MKKFTEKVLKETRDTTGLDFEFLMSWGSTLGGLMMPVSQYIEGKHPELTSLDISLLITGAMVTYYTSNKKALSKILETIKEKGLVNVFDEVLSATSNLKDTFLSFVSSLNITMGKMANMLAYTFLIPLLPQLYEMAQTGYDQNTVNQIIKRILSYGAIIGSSAIVRELIKKIVNRFRG
jgi:predicted transcriptional regulator